MDELRNHHPSTSMQPKFWTKLPPELRAKARVNICSAHSPHKRSFSAGEPEPTAACATGCREWQLHFEPILFRSLERHQDDLDNLERYVSVRRPPGPPAPDPPEAGAATRNNRILTEAVWTLFNIMAAWEGNGGPTHLGCPLELELSANSPSDWQHRFKDLKFRLNDCQSGCRKMPELDYSDFDDVNHGWVGGLWTRAAGKEECFRVLGARLKIVNYGSPCSPLARPTMPIVSSFLIRRQFYRRFEALGCLDRIMGALQNLLLFRYEPWGPIPTASGDDSRRQTQHYKDLVHIPSQRPELCRHGVCLRGLRRCQGFCISLMAYLALPQRERDTATGKLLAKASNRTGK
ncbi:hypothetical protein PG994_000695 [Apiospora phragmitis]|uniref:Uncharacterized protein n=1 Tax=Apiospora phragmitis TaxID=2905665 RepID=A0ABR1X6Y7_9PEZI